MGGAQELHHFLVDLNGNQLIRRHPSGKQGTGYRAGASAQLEDDLVIDKPDLLGNEPAQHPG